MPDTDIAAILAHGAPALHRVAVVAAAVSGGWLIARDSRTWPIPRSARINLLIAVAVGGMAGSALPALLAGGPVGARTAALLDGRADAAVAIGTVFALGPKTVIGGLIGAFIGAVIGKRATGISHDTSDAFARGCCLMMMVGRFGCLAQHCCFGASIPAWWPSWLGTELGDGITRYPVPLMEIAVLGGLLATVHLLHRRDRFAHRRLFVVFIVYGCARFLLEFLREPLAATWHGIDLYQVLAATLALIGGWQLIKRRRWIDRSEAGLTERSPPAAPERRGEKPEITAAAD